MTWVSSTVLPPDLVLPPDVRPSSQIREVPLPLPCSCFIPKHALAFPFLRNYNKTLKKKNRRPLTQLQGLRRRQHSGGNREP